MSIPFQTADELRSCLEAALSTRPNPPAQVCLRAGAVVPFNLGTTEDECCSGLGWVRVSSITPNPRRDDGSLPAGCVGSAFIAEFEIGVVRCNPFGSLQAGPTCDVWTELAFQLDEDAAAMREAVCCYASSVVDDNVIETARVGTWTPLDFSGSCAGGTMTVQVSYDCLDCP